jgi:hypothetical protein
VAASAIGMDKELMRAVFAQVGLPQPAYDVLRDEHALAPSETALRDIERHLGYPCFVKPANGGSSVGVSKARSREDLLGAIHEAARFDRKVLIEEAITGREVECAVLGNANPQPSPLGEITPQAEFYTYDAKYSDNSTELTVPARVSDAVRERVQECAVRAFRAIDCAGLARIDFFVTPDDDIRIIEVNTLPGFTPISISSAAWSTSPSSVTPPPLCEGWPRMASPRRTTSSLPLRATPAHLRAAAAVRPVGTVGRASTSEAEPQSLTRRLAASAVLIAIAVLVAFGARWLIYGSALRVTNVQLVGVEVADPLAIADAARVTNRTLLTVDRGKIAAAVASVPGVQSAVVRRGWPHTIIVEVTEYRGWGFWEVGGKRLLIDGDGHVVEHGRLPAGPAPVIYDDSTAADALPDPDAVRLVRRLLEGSSFSILRVTPTGFDFRRDRGLTVHVAEGPSAVFGDSNNFDFKVATWGALLDKVENQHLAATEIDLRFGKHVVMR